MTLLLRALLWLLPRLMLGAALWRRATGRETATDLGQRCGAGSAGGAVWLHGASNGELTSARWVIEELAATTQVHVTSSTVTGRDMVRAWAIPGVTTSLAPLDLGFALRRFLQSPPRAFINLEGEFWPARFAALTARQIPFALIGARMSARSARIWHRVGLHFLQGAKLISAQDKATEARLQALGLATQGVFDLKACAIARRPKPDWAPRETRASILLAASTHAGEEDQVLRLFAASSFDQLILAPRHPKRGDDLEARIAALGLGVTRRSRGQEATERVFLADTMGEMDLWYARAGACFVGGSLVDKGGHTPWEPARHGCAILHGPHIANFTAAYAGLAAQGAALPWSAEALAQLPPATQDRMARAAASLLAQSGDGAALIAALLAVIARK